MTYSRLEISDVILCEPKVFGDNRGYFTESFNKKSFDDFLGKSVNFLQDNESQSSKGVFRGLHYQIGPYAQAKLVRVISGSVIDFIVENPVSPLEKLESPDGRKLGILIESLEISKLK